MAKKNQNCKKSAISQFATFTQLQSPKKFYTPHFSIFSLEILNIASQLIPAVNYLLRLLKFKRNLSAISQGCRNDFLHGGGGGGGQIQIFWRFKSQPETSRRAPI